MSAPWHLTPHGLILCVHLQPRASHTRLVGFHGTALKVALTAPPVEGAANAALISFLATLLHVPRSAVSLVSGAKSREKQIFVTTATPEALSHQLKAQLARLDKKKRDD